MGLDDESFFRAEIQEGRRGRVVQPHRLVLTAAVVVAIGWMLWPIRDEVAYHFSDAEVLDLGDATSLVAEGDLPVNVPARISGVLGNKAAVVSGAFRPGSYRRGPVQVRQILGAPVFLEFDQDELGDRYTTFARVTVEGRLTDFGPGSEMEPARRYFWERFGMALPNNARLLVVDERPGQMWRYPVLVVLGVVLAGMSLTFAALGLRRRVLD
ncbi:MAG: hypothetical protein ACO3JL_02160 [Myxococcota bacterium]